MSEAKPQPYKVRAVHVVAKGADVLVREYTLDPGEAIPRSLDVGADACRAGFRGSSGHLRTMITASLDIC